MTGDTLPAEAVGWGDGIEAVTGETLGRHVLAPLRSGIYCFSQGKYNFYGGRFEIFMKNFKNDAFALDIICHEIKISWFLGKKLTGRCIY